MAVTTTSIIRCHLDRIIAQAAEMAILKAEKAHCEEVATQWQKTADEWQQRALKAEAEAEQSFVWQIASENNLQYYKVDQAKVGELEAALELAEAGRINAENAAMSERGERDRLDEQLLEARRIIEPLSLLEDVAQAFLYRDLAVDHLDKWARVPERVSA